MSSLQNNNNLSLAALDDFIQTALHCCDIEAGGKPLDGGKSRVGNYSVRPRINISESFAKQLCLQAREVLMSQASILELEAPIKICGDFHGQFHDLLRMFETCGAPPHSNFLFLGDYVDRGRYGVETICLLFAMKIRYPENFFLLRGNHECSSVNRLYGFFDECKRKFGKINAWKSFTDTFNCLPLAAIIDEKIFASHGGLSPELMCPKDFNMVKKLVRPCDVGDSGVVADLLWSDPDESTFGWAENEDRGVSFTFGSDIVDKFLKNNDMDLICRGHQVCEDGYQFFAKKRLVTIFSCPNYCGTFDNSGAIMSVDEHLMCSFTILKPRFKV